MSKTFRNKNFLVLGRAGLDLYADPPGTEIEYAGMFVAALGGSAANIAVSIAKQGGNATLLTTVSADAVGRYTLNALASYHVDTSLIRTVGGEARNSLAVVETRPENCQSVIYRNDAADFHVMEKDVEAIDYGTFAGLVVTGTALAKEPSRNATFKAMALARLAGLVVLIDIDYRPYSWASRQEAQDICLKAAGMSDIIVANDEEFAVMAGTGQGLQLARDLAGKQRCIVVYKMGARGAITFADGISFETPVYAVTTLKPTGAGDAFMGGFVSGLVAGASLPDAVQRGAATAAIVVTRVGCAPAMPDAAEVLTFMQNAGA